MIYFFDGSTNGFLTAFLTGYHDERARVTSKKTQLTIGDEPYYIKTDDKLAERAKARLLYFDPECMHDLDLLLRSGDSDSEQTAYLYFKTLAKSGKPVRNMLSIPAVFSAVEKMRRVGLEVHRLHGFIRFMETASGALYAPSSPDNDICDLLAPYFKGRFPHFPFVLHDVKRQKAAIYDGNTIFTAPLSEAQILLSANELEWQALWKNYYAAVNIPSRERIQQMKGFMPTRYWKFLPEKQL